MRLQRRKALPRPRAPDPFLQSNPDQTRPRAGFSISDKEPVMADYFTHFSCLLDAGSPENAAKAMALFHRLRAEEGV